MYKYLLILTIFAIFLSGCSPAEGTMPNANKSEKPNEQSKTDVPVELTAETIPAEDSDEGQVDQAVEPVTVDLGQITSEPAENTTEPRELPAPGIPNPLKKLVHDVSVDLSQYLKIDLSEISVVDTEDVTWRDSSLGCPEPGMNYLQVVTPGYRITLRALGQTFDYHTQGVNYFVLCQDGKPIRP